jgi:hypothetical protein
VSSMWRGDDKGKLEKELRRSRPVPRRDFVSGLVSQIRVRPERRRSFRIAFVGGLTTVMLGAVAATGGIGQAAAAMKSVVSTVSGGGASVVNNSPAHDQYKCNSGRGNLSETESGTRQTDSDTLINPHLGNTALGPGDFPTDDCDPGNSGGQNRGGD